MSTWCIITFETDLPFPVSYVERYLYFSEGVYQNTWASQEPSFYTLMLYGFRQYPSDEYLQLKFFLRAKATSNYKGSETILFLLEIKDYYNTLNFRVLHPEVRYKGRSIPCANDNHPYEKETLDW